MTIKDHDIEVLKALWRSASPDFSDDEVRAALEDVIDILSKMQESSSIYLGLTPFEAGVLTSALYKAVDEGADPIVNNIYNRLKAICNNKYYKD